MKPLLVALALTFSISVEAQTPVAPALVHSPPADAARTPPPLPFRYIGTLVVQHRLEVLLMRGHELHTVAAGDSIDGEYRVDDISETAIRFTYLPLETKQTWAFRR